MRPSSSHLPRFSRPLPLEADAEESISSASCGCIRMGFRLGALPCHPRQPRGGRQRRRFVRRLGGRHRTDTPVERRRRRGRGRRDGRFGGGAKQRDHPSRLAHADATAVGAFPVPAAEAGAGPAPFHDPGGHAAGPVAPPRRPRPGRHECHRCSDGRIRLHPCPWASSPSTTTNTPPRPPPPSAVPRPGRTARRRRGTRLPLHDAGRAPKQDSEVDHEEVTLALSYWTVLGLNPALSGGAGFTRGILMRYQSACIIVLILIVKGIIDVREKSPPFLSALLK